MNLRRFENNMHYKLLHITILVLANLLNVGMVSPKPNTSSPQVQTEDVLFAQLYDLELAYFPYEVADEIDVRQAATVGYLDQLVAFDLTNPQVPIYTDGVEMIRGRVRIHNDDASIIAATMVHVALPAEIVFSYENTVRADVIGIYYFGNLEDDEWLKAYQEIDNHPNFARAVALRKTLPPFNQATLDDYSEYSSLVGEIIRHLVKKFLDFDLGAG